MHNSLIEEKRKCMRIKKQKSLMSNVFQQNGVKILKETVN